MSQKRLIDYLILFALLGTTLGMTHFSSGIAWIATFILLVVFITDLDWKKETNG